MFALLRTLLLLILGWYLVKWLARWFLGEKGKDARDNTVKNEEKYETLTDQKIEDADYEDL
jgi:hypothetical protein